MSPLAGSLPRQPLLPVALDRRLRPDVSAFGVEASGTARPALPEQVPALVQADRELTQALTVLAGESLAKVALFQPVLEKALPFCSGRYVAAAVDDTRLHKTGRHIQSAFYQRDPLSPKFRFNLMFGLRFLQISLLVPLYRKQKEYGL